MSNQENDFDITPRRPSPPKRALISAAQLVEESPRSAKLTRWKNPTGQTLKIEIYLSLARWAQIVIAPGESVEVPSEYDRSIHQLDEHGAVIGGLAPQLRRVEKAGGLAPVYVHPGLRDSTTDAEVTR